MTCKKSLFSGLDCFVFMNIKLGYEFMGPTKGKGIVPILTKKNEKKFIHEVFYVPNMNSNMIRIGQLLQNKYDL